MALYPIVFAVLVSLSCLLVAENVAAAGAAAAELTAAPKVAETNSSRANSSRTNSTIRGGSRQGKFNGLGVDSSMIQRALYVLIGITTIGVLYFLIRAVRAKKPNQRKKYGLLSNYDDSVEMEAVESDEDETLYEARSLRR